VTLVNLIIHTVKKIVLVIFVPNCPMFCNNTVLKHIQTNCDTKSLDLTTHTSLSTIHRIIRRGLAPGFVNYKKGELDSQPHVIKFTSCLPMVIGSLRLPPNIA